MRSALLAVVTVFAIAVGGCGGGSSGGGSSASGQVTAALKTYLTGLANGNGSAACNELTSSAARELVSAASDLGAATCQKAIDAAAGYLSAKGRRTLLDAKVINVQFDGNRATATVQGGTQTADFTKVGGRWLISGGLSH